MTADRKQSLLPFDLGDRQAQLNLALGMVVLGLIGYLYLRMGKLYYYYGGYLTLEVGQMYSHAPLMPLVAAWLIWRKRFELFAAPRRLTAWALVLVVGALVMFFVGHKATQWRLLIISMVLLLWAIPFYLWGWQVAKWLLFPVGILLLAVPVEMISELSSPLKRLVSATSAMLLNLGGVPVELDGARLYSVPHGRFQLEVADACSGIRSLIALVTLAMVYGYVSRDKQWQRWALVVAAVPLAMLGNLVRVTASGAVGNAYGQAAIGTFDKFSTYVVFIPAIAALLLVDSLLDRDFGKMWARWSGGKGGEAAAR
ncbi:MAG: exosortase/archaeosortase family protein [Verrucomicrobia bacterium]|nr:exosortase/archaeosortase family protein [Verrucomicrobiota bacterium]